jgi:predicted dehydrogenase
MQRMLNIGMIGAGFIGQLAHLMNYVQVRQCKVIALAEFRPELRRKVAQRYDIPYAYQTHHELIANPDVDAVVVVTPRPYTGPVVLDCLNAGKHVISEKPMAGTSQQGRQLVEAAAAGNLHYVVGYMKRYDEGVQTAKRILDQVTASGELGPIQFVRAHCYMGDSYCKADGHVVTDEKPDYEDGGWPVSPSWLNPRLSKDYAMFVNCYSHNTNLLRYLFGKSPSIQYAQVSGPAGQIAALDFGAFPGSLETGKTSNRGWDEVTEIYFADGRLTIKTPPALLKNVPATVELYRAGSQQQILSPQCDWTWAFRRQADAFVNDILESRPSLSPGADALQDLLFIEELWRMDQARTPKNTSDSSPQAVN